MREVLRQLIGALEGGREQLICQVVETRGSTPQKAGALMVVDPDGGQVGTLGGGCVEAEVKQKAIRRIGQAGAELHAFVLDHDYAWADGLICGGKMVIVAEAVRGPGAAGLFPGLPDAPRGGRRIHRGRRGRSRTRRGRASGTRFLFDPEGTVAAAWPAAPRPATGSPSRSSACPTGPGRASGGASRCCRPCRASGW